MLILTQDRKTLVNLDNIVFIDKQLLNGDIRYLATDKKGQGATLGTYKNTPEHENQIERIAEVYGAINCYVMPKEINND